MKRRLAFLLTLCFSVALLTGCGGSNTQVAPNKSAFKPADTAGLPNNVATPPVVPPAPPVK